MHRFAKSRRSQRGLSLVELAVVLVVMLTAVSIFSNTMLATARQRVMHRESSLAADAARTMLERMLDTPFDQRFALYNDDPLDDPDGPGTAPGARFAVDGLPPVPGTPGGLPGSIRFPAVNAGTEAAPVLQLREDVVDPGLSMPSDLNSDFRVDGLDHAGDYSRLPVEVRVEWQGRVGRQDYRLVTLMVEFRR